MKSFSKRLTRRIVLALTLVLIIIIAGATIMTSRFIGTMTKAYFEHLADIENESVEKRLHDVQVAVNDASLLPHILHIGPQMVDLIHLCLQGKCENDVGCQPLGR